MVDRIILESLSVGSQGALIKCITHKVTHILELMIYVETQICKNFQLCFL